MKKLILSITFLGLLFFASQAAAQTSQSSTGSSTKDEYWGTAKAEDKGASADAVGRRANGLDTRWNAYEDSRRNKFTKDRVKNSKKMKAILKKEKEMHRKHKRDKRRLARSM
ncbi:hypothetical protein [Pontibacter ruber]|uniref:Uncharacterized protein n=1 Tax=Pontibacter ruber TaxID=1343895 RepID=A0ABW5D1B0_9BACT|nr:hypothetical protein [Pontibacter ruber]